MPERLHKYLAYAGVGSRRDCEELIEQGRVSVDGKTVTEMGTQVEPRRQTIKVDGRAVKRPPPVYYLLNKPAGVVCSMGEEEKLPRAVDFAPKGSGRVHTVGRLDIDSEGIIILTNDGELTERLTHPRHDFPKVYRVTVRGRLGAEAIAKLKRGVWLSEGKATVTRLKVLRHMPDSTLLEVELREGKNREIRRIFAKVGHPVRQLRRVAIGPLTISGIEPGKTRKLTDDEVRMLKETVGLVRGAAGPRKVTEAVTFGRGQPAKAAKSHRGGDFSAKRGPGDKAERKRTEKPDRRAPSPPHPSVPQEPPPEGEDDELPAEPKRARPRYVPDEDGVIVVRRPPVQSSSEE